MFRYVKGLEMEHGFHWYLLLEHGPQLVHHVPVGEDALQGDGGLLRTGRDGKGRVGRHAATSVTRAAESFEDTVML